MNVLLRLGCALLACAGIAAARTPAGASDEAAARRAQEQQVAPVLDESREAALASSSEGAFVRADRRVRSDSRRSTPVFVARSEGRSPLTASPVGIIAVSPPVPSRAPRDSSPRGPPASE
ncbi:MAG: hypothetical protein ACHQ51_12030 [Elusimicrobiota bacterium]